MIWELQPADPQVIGPYELRGRLGSGGMGQVYLGLSAGGRLVAVKAIRFELAADAEFRVRFRREVAAARKVSGLFTAALVDADTDSAIPWLATVYVAGPSLAEAISQHGPMPIGSVLKLGAGLAESLAAIHSAGVVHRDLKPTNVLLAADGPRVIDFGISRSTEATSLTRVGFLIGSPGFMSPEQAEDREVGPPSDIFSLGGLLAFAATGQGPFGTGATAALVYRVVHSTPDLDSLPAEIRPMITRCLAKDAADRPTTSELLAEIGDLRPADGWLPEPIIGAVAHEEALAAAGVEHVPQEPVVPGSVASVSADVVPDTITAARWAAAQTQPPNARLREPATRKHRARTRVLAVAATALAAIGLAVGLALASGGDRHLKPVSQSKLKPATIQVTTVASFPSRTNSPPPASRTSPSRTVTATRAAVPSTSAPLISPRPQQTRSPSSSPSASSSPPQTKRSSPAPSKSPRPHQTTPPASSAVPRITSVSTYQQGVLVYFDINYSDPGNDAEGFGFVGVNGSGWAEENHPFSSPSYGIVGPDSIAYPFNEACDTAQQYDSYVEAWIYDTHGVRSQPVTIHLVCTS